MRPPPETLSVLVPSYRRPEQLVDCLEGIHQQARPADEVVVARRADDLPTAEVIAKAPMSVREAVVDEPGALAAMRAAAAAATGTIVAFVDDDAVPRPDWAARLLAPFEDPAVGGAGGRDIVHQAGGVLEANEPREVGRLTEWGRPIGNHHLGVGGPRSVDVLKGVNCAYRRSVIGLPIGLRGEGAEVGWDLATSLYVKSQGYELVYDPATTVDHYPGERFDEDARGAPSRKAKLDAVYNFAYIVCSLRPAGRWRFLLYHAAVGSRATPGVARAVVGRWRHEADTGRLIATQKVVQEAARDARQRPLGFWTPSAQTA